MDPAQVAELRHIVSTIGLEEYMNAVLVQKGARKATLVEYSDDTEGGVKRSAQYISEKFPTLYSLPLKNDKYFLISKYPITKDQVKTHRQLGHILGLPCADDFESIKNNDEDVWVIDIQVYLNPGFDIDSLQLLSNLCLSEETFAYTKIMAAHFNHIFQADPLLKHIVRDVRAVARTRNEFMAVGGKKTTKSKKTRKNRRKNRRRV